MIDLQTLHAPTFTLSPEQSDAFDSMLTWFKDPYAGPFFVMQGYAGTGKTYTCQALVEAIKGRVCFTAPTNKAVKVLRETLTRDSYKPECATIYSLLGLQMVANGEVKELKGRDPNDEEKLDLSNYRLVVVDEGSMLNEVIIKHIREASTNFAGLKFLFLGDPAQLPPVGEARSLIFKPDFTEANAKLTKVMRHDNEILELVTRIRQVVDNPAPAVKLSSLGAVQVVSSVEFLRQIREDAYAGRFSEPAGAKAIAWRNLTVDKYNDIIRKVIFQGVEGSLPKFLGDDRVIFTGPARDLDDEPMARTDDEGRVTSVHLVDHPVYSHIRAIRLGITLDTNRTVTAFTLDPRDALKFEKEKNDLAATARAMPRAWKDFWGFQEAFHGVRHAYAITAHRAQGSTYRDVFVDYRDILLNRNRQEAFRCLYVACSRPTQKLWLG